MLKRLTISMGLAALVALAIIYLSGVSLSAINTSLFWAIAVPYLVIGFFVGIVGIVTKHPVFNFMMFPIRGAFVGVLITLPTLFATLAYSATPEGGALMMLATMAAFGLALDVAATKGAGQGKKLLHPENL